MPLMIWIIGATVLVTLQVAGLIALPILLLVALIIAPPVLWFVLVVALYALAYWSAFR